MAQKTSPSLSPRGRFWRKHIQQWQRSGGTQSQYCQEHDLSVSAFHWWQRKLRERNPGVDSPQPVSPVPVATFTELRIPAGDTAAGPYAYEIVLPNGIQVRLRPNFEAEATARLVSLLRAPC